MKEEDETLGKELKRKAFHLAGLVYLLVYLEAGYPLTLYLMTGWMALVAAIETARLNSPAAREVLHRWFGAIIRGKEAHRYTGAFYTSLGALLTFFFYGPRPTVVNAALLYLAVCDATAAVVGKLYGKHPYAIWGYTKTWEGSAAGFAAALACGAAIGLPAKLVLAGAAAFSVADALPLPPDDNLWIPLLTGGALQWLGA